MWFLAFIGSCASALAVLLVLLRHRRLNDWHLWVIPIALSMLATAQLQGLVGADRGLGRFADTSWLRPLGAFVSGMAALIVVALLDRLLDERERARESARLREQWVRMLTASLPAVVWTTNTNGTIVSHVGGGHRRLGFRPNQFIGSTITAYFGDETAADAVWQASKHALVGETVSLELTWRDQRYDGFLEPLYDSRNEIVGTIGFLLNKNDLSEGAASVSEYEALLSMVAAQLPAVIWVTDTNSQVTYAAGAGLAALELEPGDLVGANVEQWIANTDPSDVALDAYKTALGGEAIGYRSEFAGRRGDCFLEPLRDQDGRVTGVLGIAMASDRKLRLVGPIEDGD